MSSLSIIIEDIRRQQRAIRISSSWTYAQLHNQIVQMFGNSEFKLIFENNYLSLDTHGNATLEQLRFTNNSLIRMVPDQKLMQIIIEDINGQAHQMQVNSSWTYAELHNQFMQWFWNDGKLSVIFRNKYLSVDTHGTVALEHLNITNNCVIRVLQTIKGGFKFSFS